MISLTEQRSIPNRMVSYTQAVLNLKMFRGEIFADLGQWISLESSRKEEGNFTS